MSSSAQHHTTPPCMVPLQIPSCALISGTYSCNGTSHQMTDLITCHLEASSYISESSSSSSQTAISYLKSSFAKQHEGQKLLGYQPHPTVEILLLEHEQANTNVPYFILWIR